MYICVSIYVCFPLICIYMCIYICECVSVYMHVHTCDRLAAALPKGAAATYVVYACIYLSVRIHMYIHVDTYVNICTHT